MGGDSAKFLGCSLTAGRSSGPLASCQTAAIQTTFPLRVGAAAGKVLLIRPFKERCVREDPLDSDAIIQ